MIVDVHTHAPHPIPDLDPNADINVMMRPGHARPANYTEDDYLAGIAGVDKALVFNIAAHPGGQREPYLEHLIYSAHDVNDDVAALVRAHPDKLIGFMSVHPLDPKAADEIDRAYYDLGLRGIKLAPNYQNFDPLGEEAFRVYRRAQELGLPILFHQGTSPMRFGDLDWAHPRHMDRVATAFPDLKIVMAHMGHPWQVDCIVVIRKHPNVYADVSALFYRPWSQYNALRLATEWGVMHKLLFASDYPVATSQETIDACRSVNDVVEGTRLPRVPEDAIEALIHRDSLDLLGLG